MSELFTNMTTVEVEAMVKTIEHLWVQMSRTHRARALKAIAALPQRCGSTESLLETARRQACETGSFLPGLRYSPDHVAMYEVLAKSGRYAESTFARFWLACHRHAEWGGLIWYAVEMYLYPHWQWGSPVDYNRACFSLLRAVREARA